jgi:hypothetical protein
MSASTLPTYHRYYDDFDVTPSFRAQSSMFDPRRATPRTQPVKLPDACART